ncbi:hypothetical protein H9L39_01734 [Fusarium oxysporum f. sp. albedinis]|nr:hypothetical protein H9L39_01734 [Fusarium oxysporum f. sp. albedinis]
MPSIPQYSLTLACNNTCWSVQVGMFLSMAKQWRTSSAFAVVENKRIRFRLLPASTGIRHIAPVSRPRTLRKPRHHGWRGSDALHLSNMCRRKL